LAVNISKRPFGPSGSPERGSSSPPSDQRNSGDTSRKDSPGVQSTRVTSNGRRPGRNGLELVDTERGERIPLE
jgi:hypothetical protein